MVHDRRRMVATDRELTLAIADHAVEPEGIFAELADALIDLADVTAQLLDSAVRSCIHAAGRAAPGWTATTVRRASVLVSAGTQAARTSG